jgi:hypothetical protein
MGHPTACEHRCHSLPCMKCMRGRNAAADWQPCCPPRAAGLRSAQRRSFRAAVIQLVLGSDMSRHFSLLSRFKAAVASCPAEAPTAAGYSNDERRQVVMQVLILHLIRISARTVSHLLHNRDDQGGHSGLLWRAWPRRPHPTPTPGGPQQQQAAPGCHAASGHERQLYPVRDTA